MKTKMKNILTLGFILLSLAFCILLLTWFIGILNILSLSDNKLKALEVYASFLIPILTVIIGYYVFKMNKTFEHTIVLKTKVIDKRVEYYSKVSGELNDVYTYIIRVGEWKSKKPKDIIQHKREISKIMYISKPFWSEEVFSAYRSFILSVFETNTGHREDAKIKADIEKYGTLTKKQKKMFTGKRANKDDIKLKYSLLEKAFSKDMGVN